MAGWIGVDLDGTLAHYDGWRGAEHIVLPMVKRVKKWMADGIEVRVFTARVFPIGTERFGSTEEEHSERLSEAIKAHAAIVEWCKVHIGKGLRITCTKDYGMYELWDDRAMRIVGNTGLTCCEYDAALRNYAAGAGDKER